MEERGPLQQLRHNLGLTQEELSHYLGIPKRTIENYESGERTPPDWVFDLILDKLGLYEKESREIYDETHGVYSLSQIRLKLYPLFKEAEVRKAVLFGSYAKGKDRPDSDIDFVVDVSLEGLAFFDFAHQLELVLHKKVDLYRRDQLIEGGKAEQEVQKTGVRIYG